MKRLTAIFVATLALPTALHAEGPALNCAPGRLMDASSVTSRNTTNSDASGNPVKTYTIRLEVEDVVYTVESTGSVSFDPLRLTNRENLTICVVDRKLTIRRKDGTELKTTVVKEVVESNY